MDARQPTENIVSLIDSLKSEIEQLSAQEETKSPDKTSAELIKKSKLFSDLLRGIDHFVVRVLPDTELCNLFKEFVYGSDPTKAADIESQLYSFFTGRYATSFEVNSETLNPADWYVFQTIELHRAVKNFRDLLTSSNQQEELSKALENIRQAQIKQAEAQLAYDKYRKDLLKEAKAAEAMLDSIDSPPGFEVTLSNLVNLYEQIHKFIKVNHLERNQSSSLDTNERNKLKFLMNVKLTLLDREIAEHDTLNANDLQQIRDMVNAIRTLVTIVDFDLTNTKQLTVKHIFSMRERLKVLIEKLQEKKIIDNGPSQHEEEKTRKLVRPYVTPKLVSELELDQSFLKKNWKDIATGTIIVAAVAAGAVLTFGAGVGVAAAIGCAGVAVAGGVGVAGDFKKNHFSWKHVAGIAIVGAALAAATVFTLGAAGVVAGGIAAGFGFAAVSSALSSGAIASVGAGVGMTLGIGLIPSFLAAGARVVSNIKNYFSKSSKEGLLLDNSLDHQDEYDPDASFQGKKLRWEKDSKLAVKVSPMASPSVSPLASPSSSLTSTSNIHRLTRTDSPFFTVELPDDADYDAPDEDLHSSPQQSLQPSSPIDEIIKTHAEVPNQNNINNNNKPGRKNSL